MALVKKSVTPTITAGAYSANDVIGGRLRFNGLAPGAGISIKSILITDNGFQNVKYVLVLFDTTPTDITDNATFDIADADIANICYPPITFDNASVRYPFTDNAINMIADLDIPIRSAETTGDIWAFLYTTGAPSYAATTDITVVIRGDPL